MATLVLSASLQAIADACGMVDFIRRCQVRSAVPAAQAATACCSHGRHPQLGTLPLPLGTLRASATLGCKLGCNLLLTQAYSSLPKSSQSTCHPLCSAVARGWGGRRALERGARRLLLLRPGRGGAAGQGAVGWRCLAGCGELFFQGEVPPLCLPMDVTSGTNADTEKRPCAANVPAQQSRQCHQASTPCLQAHEALDLDGFPHLGSRTSTTKHPHLLCNDFPICFPPSRRTRPWTWTASCAGPYAARCAAPDAADGSVGGCSLVERR